MGSSHDGWHPVHAMRDKGIFMNSKKVAIALSPSTNPVRDHSVRCELKLAISLLLFMLSTSLGQAQTPDSNPFEQSVRTAIDSNHSIRAAKATLEATKERYHQSLADLLPDVSLNASKTRRFVQRNGTSNQNIFSNGITNQNGFGDNTANQNLSSGGNSDEYKIREDLTRIGVSIAQPLLKWPSVLALEQTKSIISSSEADLDATSQEVLLETIQTIITVLLTENMARLAESNLSFTRRNREATLARRKAGYLTRTDVDQAAARVSSAEAELIHAKNEAMVARARFEEVVRMPVPAGLNVPNIPPHLLQGDLETFSSQIHNRPSMKAAKFRIESSDYTVDIEKAGHLPVINLSADANTYRGYSDTQSLQGNEYSVAIQLSLPLFSGGRTLSRTREASHTKTSKQIEFDRIQNQALREVKQAYFEMHSAQATVKSSEAAFVFYNEALRGIQEEFRAGFRTVIDLLESQNQLFRSETDRLKNHYELVSSQYQLLYTIGFLTLKNIHAYEDTPPISDNTAADGMVPQPIKRLKKTGMVPKQAPIPAKIAWENLPFLSQEARTQLTVHVPTTAMLTKTANRTVGPTIKPLNAERIATQTTPTNPSKHATFTPIRTKTGEKKEPAKKQAKNWGIRLTRSLGSYAIRPTKSYPATAVTDAQKTTTEGSFFVCVGSFKKAKSVAWAEAQLAAIGHTPLKEEIQVRGHALTRVLYGPFKTSAQALAAQKRLSDTKTAFTYSIVTHTNVQAERFTNPSVPM